ncbi:MAG: aminotransferase class V-fold PLP-dependent enzyme [Clostridiales bacterium]|jgi:cysteine desulfurase|nr:aminotransferase class V-fold PLP-dependent enzyme [Clostridiales bacterium]
MLPKILQNYIYLDNAATVKCFEEVNKVSLQVEQDYWYNSSALYQPSLVVSDCIERAREQVAKSLDVAAQDIYFVGSATEANNWAINKGIKDKNGKVLYSIIEHASVSTTVQNLSTTSQQVLIDSQGRVDLLDLQSKLTTDTTLVSIAHVCGNSGVVNNISDISKLVRKLAPKAILHSDGVQAWCKWDYSLVDLDVDMYTVSAHKIGGKKGLGILYIRKGLNISSLINGGGHERGKRAGTVNNSSIISLPCAIDAYRSQPMSHYQVMHDYIKSSLKNIDILMLPTDLPHIFVVCFGGLRAEILQRQLCDQGVIVGVGSACSAKDKVNKILSIRNIDRYYLNGAIRISLGPHNTMQEIQQACDTILRIVNNV